jgi:hypothetical protein
MQMSHRAAKFASAILASFLANAPLTTISYSTASAADECLTEPKDQTPQGSHWFYRLEHGTKRHCWYLKNENDKLSQTAPADSSPVAKPVAPGTETTVQRSLADARAELPLPQTRFDPPPPGLSAGQRMAAPAVNAAASPESDQRAAAPDASPPASLIASRWPDSSSLNAPVGPGPTVDNSDANAQADVAAASPAVATVPPAVAAVPLAAADSSSVKQPVSMQTLLLVVIGALALAGLIGSAVFRFGSRRRNRRRGSRRVNWDAAAIDRPSRPDYPRQRAPMPRVDVPRELRAANDPDAGIANVRAANDGVADDRITEMLARLARSSMN